MRPLVLLLAALLAGSAVAARLGSAETPAETPIDAAAGAGGQLQRRLQQHNSAVAAQHHQHQRQQLLADGAAETGGQRRLLQQRLDCTRVHRACGSCRNQRIKGSTKTETVCSACVGGWRLRKDGLSKTCGELWLVQLTWHAALEQQEGAAWRGRL